MTTEEKAGKLTHTSQKATAQETIRKAIEAWPHVRIRTRKIESSLDSALNAHSHEI